MEGSGVFVVIGIVMAVVGLIAKSDGKGGGGSSGGGCGAGWWR
jgi:hypothetical protein